eukprot:gene36456-47467_t
MPSATVPTFAVTQFPTATPSSSPTFIPSTVPSFSLTNLPSSAPTIIPYKALFTKETLFFYGDNFHAFSSLPKALNFTFSISVWITASSYYPASIVSLGRSAASSSNQAAGEFVLEIDKKGNLHFWDYSPTRGVVFSVSGGKVLNNAGSRVHVTVSRNGRDYSIYINGRSTAHAVSSADIVYQNAFLVFGMDYRNRSNFFEGTMDHIAIYSQSLSGSEINALYNAEVGAPTPSPLNAGGGSGSSGGGPIQSNSKCDVTCIISIA